jgi:hypothetical protein
VVQQPHDAPAEGVEQLVQLAAIESAQAVEVGPVAMKDTGSVQEQPVQVWAKAE